MKPDNKARWTIGVYALVVNDKKQVLLIKRKDNGLWQSPGGGVSYKESPLKAVVRETQEESGFIVEVEKFLGAYFSIERNDMILTFQCDVVGGKPIISDETTDVRFFSLNTLPKMTPATIMRIRDYLAHDYCGFVAEI